MLLVILMVNKLLECFMQRNCKKINQNDQEKKVIKRKDDKLYVKWN